MGSSLLQGSALPSTVTTQQQQSTAPQFYTDYLQNIANLGQNAVTQGGVAGLSGLQTQAYGMAPCVAFAGSGTMGAGTNLATTAGTTGAGCIVGGYMNPYTSAVVCNMARLSQQNVQRNVLPAINAAAVGSGQYGSQRMENATGQALACIAANLTGQQYGALQTGFCNAMKYAETCLNRMLCSARTLGGLGTQQSQAGINALNELATLGAQCQAQAQKILCYPMTQAQNYAKLMGGYNIPTGTTTQITAPGKTCQYANSPLSQITGLMAALGSFMPKAISNTSNTSTTAGGSSGGGGGGGIGGGLISTALCLVGCLFGFAEGGQVSPKGYADGGGVQGGLQSTLQDENPAQKNVPMPCVMGNPNVPSIGLNPPTMTPPNLSYNSIGGYVCAPNFDPERG